RVWYDYEMPWLVEGYDYCSRMNRMENNGQCDIIRLLRSDGSILELRNPYKWGTEGGTRQRFEFVTGHYFEDAMNATGWAEVSIDTNRLTSDRLAQVREIVNSALGQADTNYWKRQLYQYLPRRVRYFPGNGLEYVFVEHQLPFGWEPYNGDGTITGGATAGPTIFYLKEINDASGVVMALNYSRHESPGDGTRGRALIKDIGEYVHFSYADKFVSVEAHGRTITLQLDEAIPLSDFDVRGGGYKDKRT